MDGQSTITTRLLPHLQTKAEITRLKDVSARLCFTVLRPLANNSRALEAMAGSCSSRAEFMLNHHRDGVGIKS